MDNKVSHGMGKKYFYPKVIKTKRGQGFVNNHFTNKLHYLYFENVTLQTADILYGYWVMGIWKRVGKGIIES